MSKRHREDQWQESGPKFHFILWESSAEGFVYESPLRVDAVIDEGDSGTGEGPRLCKECDGVTEPWKRSLELVHCCLRMTAKEGRAFRPEVLHLAALSPQTAIDYNVESFRLYNKRRRKNVLTESTVLAVPVHVMEGTVSADESGVTVEQLQGVEHAVEWLRGFAQQVRQMADAENGKTALVFVQEDGIPVVPFGMPMQFFKHEKEEIRHVIVILAASDAAARDFDRLQRACIAKDACDCGPFHLSVPAWRQPHAAIGFLLMQHDRKELMPLLEDLRSVGEKAYEAFQEALKEAITCVAMASRKKKRETVDRFIATARSASCEVDSVAPVRPKVNGPVPPSEPPPPWLAKRKPEPKAMPVQPQEKLKADPNKVPEPVLPPKPPTPPTPPVVPTPPPPPLVPRAPLMPPPRTASPEPEASRAVRWERLSDRPVLPTAKSAPSRRATPPLTLFQVLERPGPVQTESRVQVPQANGQNGWAHGEASHSVNGHSKESEGSWADDRGRRWTGANG